MNDEELDKLFRDAANRFQPPDVPEDAWDVFYKTKMLPAGNKTEKRGQWAGLAAILGRFFVPKLSWQFATTCVLALITGLLLIHTKPPAGNIAGGPAKDRARQQPVTGTTAPSSVETGQGIPGIGNSRNDAKSNRGWNGDEPYPADLLSRTGAAPFTAPLHKPAPFDLLQKPAGATRATPADSISGRHNMDFSLRRKPAEASHGKPALPDHYRFPQAEPTAGRSNTRSRWQVGLLAGSNLGMVRGDVSKKPGLNAGVLVQKKLGRSRFSIESGVLYESMTYDVNNADFTPNGKPVSSRVSNIEGACTMIDVPVNVRYDVVASKKNKAFVSTGVSPTMIVKQSYVYDYDPGDGPVQVNRDVSGRGKSVYAVANLSVGYEQKWNHVSVQIAPYVKIPMGEIGYGNLSLGGIGTQISIKKDL